MLKFKDFIDTTLREGQQSPLLFDTFKYHFDLKEKKQIIKSLIELGISHFEFFSPMVSDIERKDFLKIKSYVRSISSRKIFLLAHCRCNLNDILTAIKTGFDGLNFYMGISKLAQQTYGKSKKEIIELIKQTVIFVRKKYPQIYLRFSIEDGFRTPLGDIFLVYDQISKFVNTFGLPDTTGVATPDEVKRRIKLLKKRYPQNYLECHFHNDRGYALINTLTAIENGAEYIDTSVWGLGERSGIASITGVLLNLYYLDNKIAEKYRLELCYPLNVLLGSILKMQVPATEPVSLTNRTHIAGVHQDAVLKNKTRYEAHPLERFGVTSRQLLLGPLTGWHHIYYYLKEIKNLKIDEEKAKEITKTFKNKVTKEKNKNPEEVLIEIVKKYSLVKMELPSDFEKKRVEKLD
jgi:homocitrate synthase